MYSETTCNTLLLSLNISFILAQLKVASNGLAIMVLSVKYRPKWKQHFSCLYLQQVFEWWRIWYVFTKS